MTGQERSQRRWRFTLRQLLAAVFLLSLPSAWFGHQYNVGQRADIVVRDLGGRTSRWWHWDWRWGQVKTVRLSGVPITDEDLKLIVGISTIGSLDLSGTAITDKGLDHLIDLKNLVALDLSDTRITDQGLQVLEDMPQLQMLQAHRTNVSDPAVDRLRRSVPPLQVYYRAN